MKIKFVTIFLGTIASFSVLAKSSLIDSRVATVKNYFNSLQEKDATNIQTLFSKNGTVISTSKGKMNAGTFFNGFLPELSFSEIKLSQIYISMTDPNHFSAKFHFNYKLKDGEVGGGDYIDDFSFAKDSDKLTNVHMFENLKG